MKTIKQTLIDKLQEHGLWLNETEEVMAMVEAAMVEAAPANVSLQGRWNDSSEGYPKGIMAHAWLSARDNALEWIAKNKPMHIAKRMLESV